MNKNGFTLIEMLLVVAVLGTMSGVLVSVINQSYQKQRATDAVNRTKLEQLVQGLESVNSTDGLYPSALNGAPDFSQATVKEMIVSWPDGFTYVVNNSRSDFAVYVAISNGNYLKYTGGWGKFKICTSASIAQLSFCTEVGN